MQSVHPFSKKPASVPPPLNHLIGISFAILILNPVISFGSQGLRDY